MPLSLFPPQLGFKPTGTSNGTALISTLYIGRILTGNGYDGPGFGAGGRPDYVENIIINLVDTAGGGPNAALPRGSITINAADLSALLLQRPLLPSNLNLTLTELIVCQNSQPRGMVVLGSQTYPTGTS